MLENPSGFGQPPDATPPEPRLQTVSWLIWDGMIEQISTD